MDAKELNKLWQSYQLRVTDEIAKSPEVLFCNGSVIGTLGNFSASTGKAKSKKSVQRECDSCGCTYQWRGLALYRRVSR